MAVFRSTTPLKFFFSVVCRPEPILVKFYSQKTTKFTDGPIDPEINFHGNLAETWWETGALQPLHNLNQVRVPFIRDGIRQLMPQNSANPGLKTELEGVDILDVGCGGGILSEALARLKANVTGLDPSSDLIKAARKHAEIDPQLNDVLRYESDSIHNFSRKNESKFDAVAVSEVIEHISNKQKFVQDCLTCLKPGGSIFFTTPNKTLAARLFIIALAEGFGVIPRGTHTYDKFITAEDLSRLLKAFFTEWLKFSTNIRSVLAGFRKSWARHIRFGRPSTPQHFSSNSQQPTGRIRSPCWAKKCSVRHGMAWHGMAWHGMTWHGMMWCGMVWCGVVSNTKHNLWYMNHARVHHPDCRLNQVTLR
ncbi:hypothetical protein V9T40_005525 [Parthenolecanium corni]|uniref:Polyprenyldihydroxybenzoate methyltransferase n=1 Tax=Parthenolecanium corni TaxID=536013 RepID=A0AAN9TW13_9HEMI